jgi:hypothetical protein
VRKLIVQIDKKIISTRERDWIYCIVYEIVILTISKLYSLKVVN